MELLSANSEDCWPEEYIIPKRTIALRTLSALLTLGIILLAYLNLPSGGSPPICSSRIDVNNPQCARLGIQGNPATVTPATSTLFPLDPTPGSVLTPSGQQKGQLSPALNGNEQILPDLTGKPLAVARLYMKRLGLHLDFVEHVLESDPALESIITDQNPPAGSKINSHSSITVIMGARVVIDEPADLSIYTMQTPDYSHFAPLTLQAHLVPEALNAGAILSWTGDIQYKSAGDYGPGKEFSSTIDHPLQMSQPGLPAPLQLPAQLGGTLTLKVIARTQKGKIVNAKAVHCLLTGTALPNDVVVSTLQSVYHGQTYGLLVGIGRTESNLQQFTARKTKVNGNEIMVTYPTESRGGGHIGIMQMNIIDIAPDETSRLAWDWRYNINAGANLYSNWALPAAFGNMQKYQQYVRQRPPSQPAGEAQSQFQEQPKTQPKPLPFQPTKGIKKGKGPAPTPTPVPTPTPEPTPTPVPTPTPPPNLLNLTPQQIEDNALCYYSGYSDIDPETGIRSLYWVPSKDGTEWVVNYTTYQKNSGCYSYVNNVRASSGY